MSEIRVVSLAVIFMFRATFHELSFKKEKTDNIQHGT